MDEDASDAMPVSPDAGTDPTTRRIRARLAVLAGLLVLTLVGGAFAITQRGDDIAPRNAAEPIATTAGSNSATPAAAKGPAAEAAREAAIEAILARRAEAVLRRDLTAWLADVDSDPAFVASQEQVFSNLSQITCASWSYELGDDPAPPPGRSEKYGGTTYLPQIILRYAIKDFDPKPIAVPTGWTFVSRGDGWKIVSDSDLDGTLPPGHAAPWDEREILVRQGKYVLLLIDAEDRRHAGRFLRMADDAVLRVRKVWPAGWRQRVVVSMVRDQAAYDTHLTEQQAAVEATQFVAIATPVHDEIPGWTVPEEGLERESLASYRVSFNPRLFDPESPHNPDSLAHEVTHVATARHNSSVTPRWLFEGAAEYTAQPTRIPSPPHLPDELRREFATGSVELPIDDTYQGSPLAPYRIGQFACYLIATRFGENTLRKIYQRLGLVGEDRDIRTEQDKVFRELLGMGTKQFERELASYIKSQS